MIPRSALDLKDVLSEPLFTEIPLRNSRYGWRFLSLVSLLLGLGSAALLSFVPCGPAEGWQHPTPQNFAITMSAGGAALRRRNFVESWMTSPARKYWPQPFKFRAANLDENVGGVVRMPETKASNSDRNSEARAVSRMSTSKAPWWAAAAMALAVGFSPRPATATMTDTKADVSLSELVRIVKEDFTQRKYLITGDLTKAVYADDAHFADSNNDFGNGLDSWVRGVKALFVSNRCKLALTDAVTIDEANRKIIFEGWRQVDVFRIPGAPHTPVFTGRTVLTLDPTRNIVVDHTEIWDQKPSDIVSNLKFFDPNFSPDGFDQ